MKDCVSALTSDRRQQLEQWRDAAAHDGHRQAERLAVEPLGNEYELLEEVDLWRVRGEGRGGSIEGPIATAVLNRMEDYINAVSQLKPSAVHTSFSMESI